MISRSSAPSVIQKLSSITIPRLIRCGQHVDVHQHAAVLVAVEPHHGYSSNLHCNRRLVVEAAANHGEEVLPHPVEPTCKRLTPVAALCFEVAELVLREGAAIRLRMMITTQRDHPF